MFSFSFGLMGAKKCLGKFEELGEAHVTIAQPFVGIVVMGTVSITGTSKVIVVDDAASIGSWLFLSFALASCLPFS